MIPLLAGEREPRETSRAVQACNDFLRMGPGRSIAELHRSYIDLDRNSTPTRSKGTLLAWSSRYDWFERAIEYDTRLEEEKTRRAQEIMATGLALEHERVEKLKRLAGFLEEEAQKQNEEGAHYNVWLPDVKQIGGGEDAERVDIVRFNAAIISEYRGILDDLAKETGGRKQRQELDLQSGGKPIAINEVVVNVTRESDEHESDEDPVED